MQAGSGGRKALIVSLSGVRRRAQIAEDSHGNPKRSADPRPKRPITIPSYRPPRSRSCVPILPWFCGGPIGPRPDPSCFTPPSSSPSGSSWLRGLSHQLDELALAPAPVADDGRGTPYVVNKSDNICGLDQPRQLTSPAVVDYASLVAATAEYREIEKKKIDPNSSEGITLMTKARARVLKACESVRSSNGHCSVWKRSVAATRRRSRTSPTRSSVSSDRPRGVQSRVTRAVDRSGLLPRSSPRQQALRTLTLAPTRFIPAATSRSSARAASSCTLLDPAPETGMKRRGPSSRT